MYNFVQCRQRTVSPVFRVVKSQENLISRGALDPNHHGTRLRLRGLVARSGRGKPAFKVSTEPTRVHKDHFVNVASMQTTTKSFHGRAFPAHCAKLSRRGHGHRPLGR
jgi:hypothetical protein